MHGLIRITDAEKIVLGLRGLDAVLDIELQVDDVFVVRQHQSFLQAARRPADTDFRLTYARDIHQFRILHGPRHTPVKAGSCVRRVAAERRHDPHLTFGDNVKPSGAPPQNAGGDQRHESPGVHIDAGDFSPRHPAEMRLIIFRRFAPRGGFLLARERAFHAVRVAILVVRTTGVGASAQHTGNALIEVVPEGVQVASRIVLTARGFVAAIVVARFRLIVGTVLRSVFTFVVTAAGTAPMGVIQGHKNSFSSI